MNLIHNLHKPTRLVLAWQASGDSSSARKRRAVAEIVSSEGGATLRYLVETDDFSEALKHGFDSYPAFPDMTRVYDKNVIEIFRKRLPSKKRADYRKFLLANRISPDVDVDDVTLLGYAEAKLPSDGFSIVNPLCGLLIPSELMVEVAGFRFYCDESSGVSLGDEVVFVDETTNRFDMNAMAIYTRGQKIGYINRIQVKCFRNLIRRSNVIAVVERIIDFGQRKSAYVFVKLQGQKFMLPNIADIF